MSRILTVCFWLISWFLEQSMLVMLHGSHDAEDSRTEAVLAGVQRWRHECLWRKRQQNLIRFHLVIEQLMWNLKSFMEAQW